MLRRIAVSALLAAGTLAVALSVALQSGGGQAHAITNCDTSEAGTSAAEQQMLGLINGARAQANLPPLKFSPALNQAAAWKSADRSAYGTYPNDPLFSHTDSLGRSVKERTQDCGYGSGTYGENIAYGSSDPQLIFSLWMQSSGHRGNINGTKLDGSVNPDYMPFARTYVVIGIGLHNGAWTTDFGSFDDSGSSVGATGGQTVAASTPTATTTPLPTSTPLPTATPTPRPAPLAGISLQLYNGMNLVTFSGPDEPVADAVASLGGQLLGVYAWDPVGGHWDRFAPGVPAYAATISSLHRGQVYYLEIAGEATWAY